MASSRKDVYLTHQADRSTFIRNHELPEGYTNLASWTPTDAYLDNEAVWTAVITAGEQVESVNRIIAEVTCDGHPTVGLIPITILG